MNSPLYGLRHIHKVIRHMLDGLEKSAKETDYTDAQQLQGFTGQFPMVSQMLSEHIKHEDGIFFPALEAKVPHVIPNYHMDHRGDEEVLSEIDQLLRRLQGSPQADAGVALGQEVYREVVGLTPHRPTICTRKKRS